MAITIGTDGWITAAQVRTEFLAQLSSRYATGDGVITDTIIEAAITRAFHRINGRARSVGYTLAALAADTSALGWLKQCNGTGAARYVVLNQSAMTSQAVPAVAEEYRREFDAMLDEITDGSVSFTAAQDARESETPMHESLLEDGDDEEARVTLSNWSTSY